MGTKNKIRHFKPFPLKQIIRLRLLGFFIVISGPLLFFYKYPDNTPFSFFIELLLILFGVVILKDCWISQQYWRNKSEANAETTNE